MIPLYGYCINPNKLGPGNPIYLYTKGAQGPHYNYKGPALGLTVRLARGLYEGRPQHS